MTSRAVPFDYSTVTYAGRPLAQRISRRMLVVLLRLLVRLEVDGLERLPAAGSYILAANHLDALDPAIGLLLIPGRVVGIAKEKWNRPPFRWLLAAMSDVLFVGKSNRRALDGALEALTTGAVVAILPEGTRSRTGTLGAAYRGVASLAARARAPVVPAAAFGQEVAMTSWRRLRRAPVHVTIGVALPPPRIQAAKPELEGYTEDIMRAIAEMLPERYRGVYGSSGSDSASPSRTPMENG
jgi:1-acyl-sn-glycerol-3-phosphate acyltransferase